MSTNKLNKIAFICNSLKGGGAEAVMTTLSILFKNMGVTVDFLVLESKGIYTQEVSKNVNLINLNCKTRFLVPKLIRYLKNSKPQIIFSTQSHINIATVIAAKFTGTKSVVREATTPSIAFNINQNKLSFLLKSTYPRATKVVAVSNGVKEDLVKNFNLDDNHIKTIYNPIVSKKLFSMASEKIIHPWYNEKAPIVVSMGRFDEAKDYPTLIKAFSIIVKTIDCKLIILGNTDASQKVKSKVQLLIKDLNLSDKVDLVGFKKNPFPFIEKADLYILSSKYEGLPGALIQATALGCKIVSTDCKSGPYEILEGGKYGTLVPVGDYTAMAQAGISLLATPKTEIHSRENFRQLFSEEGIFQQYLQLFNNILVSKN